jgi:hypothetical protein
MWVNFLVNRQAAALSSKGPRRSAAMQWADICTGQTFMAVVVGGDGRWPNLSDVAFARSVVLERSSVAAA